MPAKGEEGFYGRQYYESYLPETCGYPSIADRARLDLSERCLFWLRTLLRYKSPPGRVLELGSAHGGFVALMKWIGFDAAGLEVSPWLVDLARETFEIPVLLGPVEQQEISLGSLDAIALMDVLEHFPDPVRSIQHCLSLLKPDGLLLIQTPRFPEERTFEQLRAENAPFLAQLKPREHLYLFNQQSIRDFFVRLGVPHVRFEPAIFSAYDMCLIASRSEVQPVAQPAPLAGSPSARLVQALLDLDDRLRGESGRLAACEEDRAARLDVIDAQATRLGAVEGERNRLAAELRDLHVHFEASEADRAARLDVIHAQGTRLGAVEGERNRLAARVERLERARSALLASFVFRLLSRLGVLPRFEP
ncbi:MAG: methyltransferase domain-containing protein [Bryobacteraceae bacterium]